MPPSLDAQPDAVESLWRTFHEQVHAFVLRRVPSAIDADDVVQDIFLRIHQGINNLRADHQVQAWVFTIARRTIADFYRKHYRRLAETHSGLDDLPASEESPISGNRATFAGDHSVHEEVLSWLRPMIAQLPEKYRVPLYLADVEGYTQREVAERLGLSLSGAKSRVQRARVMLGNVLNTCCQVEFGPAGEAIEFRRRSAR